MRIYIPIMCTEHPSMHAYNNHMHVYTRTCCDKWVQPRTIVWHSHTLSLKWREGLVYIHTWSCTYPRNVVCLRLNITFVSYDAHACCEGYSEQYTDTPGFYSVSYRIMLCITNSWHMVILGRQNSKYVAASDLASKLLNIH